MRIYLCFFLLILITAGSAVASDATASQYLYMVHKILPEQKNVAIFMSGEQAQKEQKKLTRAAASFKLKVFIYLIADARDIGKNLKRIKDGEPLILYDSPALMSKSSMQFILIKCKENNIPVFSASMDYVKSGAFVGIIMKDNSKKVDHVMVNLKNFNKYTTTFTDKFNVALGIREVLK